MEHQSYLDDEANRKNNLDSSSNYTTYLSSKIREIVQGKCTTEDEEFSWVNPADYGLGLWAEFESPVPDAINQVGGTIFMVFICFFFKKKKKKKL